MDLSQNEMCLCFCLLRQQQGESQEKDKVAETPHYLLKELSYLEQGWAKELASAGWCISLVPRASGQAGVPWAWLVLPPMCALNKDVCLHY